jgi:hypothetical protein
MKKDSKKFVCKDCFRLKKCKEKTISWVFFFVALIATISIRAVNVALNFHPLLAKFFWYLGVGGFFIFFMYKFRNDHILHREFERTNLINKLLSKKELTDYDYEILGTVICKLSSKKDKINYFFIFFLSGLALVLAIYMDFFR